MKVTVEENHLDDLVRNVEELTRIKILVGIPADSPHRSAESGDPSPPTNALIGYMSEFGEPDRNIPPRPHLIPSIEALMPRVVPIMRKAGEAAIMGHREEMHARFQAVGIMAQNAVRAYITSAAFTPLAPMTLAKRRARGRTGTMPLLDTGQFRRAYTYVITQKAH